MLRSSKETVTYLLSVVLGEMSESEGGLGRGKNFKIFLVLGNSQNAEK